MILMLYGALLNLAVIDRFVFIWNVSELIVDEVAVVEITALGSLNTHWPKVIPLPVAVALTV